MKKIIISSTLIVIFFIIFLIFFLTKYGIETKKFNKFIVNEIEKVDSRFKISLQKIKIKLDINELNLFLSTENLNVSARKIKVPIAKLRIYVNFFPLLKSELDLKKITVFIDPIPIKDIQKLAVEIKPSEFKSFLLNKITGGSIKINADLDFKENFQLSNFEVSGSVKNTKINYDKKYNLDNLNFNFQASKNFVNFEQISTDYKTLKFSEGEIKVKKEDEINITGNIAVDINHDNSQLKEITPLFNKNNIFENKFSISSKLKNNFNITISDTLKILDYKLKVSGNIFSAKIDFKKSLLFPFLKNEIKKISLNKSLLEINYGKKIENDITLKGKYKVNDNNFEKFFIKNDLNKKNSSYEFDFDFNDEIFIELLNFKKDKEKISNIKIKLQSNAKKTFIDEINYTEGKNLIKLNGLSLNKKNQLIKVNKLIINTFKNDLENNNFSINFKKDILISGSKYDATYLLRQINNRSETSFLNKINKNIEINLDTITTKLSIPLKKFRLIGQIEKGKFIKISSKSEFKDNKYLDIKLSKPKGSKIKYLEIYSDLPKVLLTNYKFFNGIDGGTLLFNSSIAAETTNSTLTIKKFNVKDAPGFAKLLTLADFGGIADLLKGEGIRFDILEVKTFSDNKTLTIDEIFATGPSISILMDGYVEETSGLISLRGTMVPAKKLNLLISKIPVIGNILIPKEAGEGLFGVSFKIKGKPDETKTSVNPIKTLTPRFITKALERYKEN